MPSNPGSIVYLTPRLPSRSETFVYREVRALRARDWRVTTVPLQAADPAMAAELPNVAANTIVVYPRRARERWD